jgi:hypothetical protein
MSWQIEYLQHAQTVVIKTSGFQDIAMARQMVVEAADCAAKFGAKRFLKDDSDSVLKLTTVEIYGLPGLLVAGGIPRDSRIAVIKNSVPSQAGDFQFFKTRMYNEGMPHVQIFAGSREQALEWLTEPAPAKTGPLLPP